MPPQSTKSLCLLSFPMSFCWKLSPTVGVNSVLRSTDQTNASPGRVSACHWRHGRVAHAQAIPHSMVSWSSCPQWQLVFLSYFPSPLLLLSGVTSQWTTSTRLLEWRLTSRGSPKEDTNYYYSDYCTVFFLVVEVLIFKVWLHRQISILTVTTPGPLCLGVKIRRWLPELED